MRAIDCGITLLYVCAGGGGGWGGAPMRDYESTHVMFAFTPPHPPLYILLRACMRQAMMSVLG